MLGLIYNRRYYLTHPHRFIADAWYFWIKEPMRKLVTGYNCADRADSGSSIARYALPLVRWHRKHGSGFPVILYDGESFKDWDALSGEEAVGRWHHILDEIEFALYWTQEDEEIDTPRDPWHDEYERYKEGLRLFGEYLPALWD